MIHNRSTGSISRKVVYTGKILFLNSLGFYIVLQFKLCLVVAVGSPDVSISAKAFYSP